MEILPDDSGAEGPSVDRVPILLVDDQPENLVALSAVLEPLGQSLILAGSGREALRVLLKEEVALILLDVKMPDIDGLETAELIRQRERTRHTPIIFLTAAETGDAAVLRGYAAGAVDYLMKPLVPEFVRSKVSVFVELAKKTEALKRQARDLQESERAARELAEVRAALLGALEHKNHELESFSYAVSHDLRTPLRSIEGFSQLLWRRYGDRLDEEGREFIHRVCEASQQMAHLIEDILTLSRVSLAEMRREPVDLTALASEIVAELVAEGSGRLADFKLQEGLTAVGDERLLRTALTNLLGNAWKFTGKVAATRIEFGFIAGPGTGTFFVSDNGVGFDPVYADKLFSPFQRLHSAADFPGTGVGLATVQRIIQRHGGRVWAEAAIDQGATFYFTL